MVKYVLLFFDLGLSLDLEGVGVSLILDSCLGVTSDMWGAFVSFDVGMTGTWTLTTGVCNSSSGGFWFISEPVATGDGFSLCDEGSTCIATGGAVSQWVLLLLLMFGGTLGSWDTASCVGID